MQVTSFDSPEVEEDAQPRSPLNLFAARQRRLRVTPPTRRTIRAPCTTLRLEPLRGNLHEFVAVEHTAIFDVLTPPYDDVAGRSCHYYARADGRQISDPEGDDAVEVELQEIGWPPSLRVVNRPFHGPAVGTL